MKMSSNNGIPGFIEIFEGRLQKMKDRLKEELSKAKSERSRNTIRRLTADAKKLNKTLTEMRNTTARKCPHCGEKI